VAAGMADDTKRFSSGDRWNPTASVLNGWQDASDYVRDLERGGGSDAIPMGLIRGDVLPVKNNSGADRGRFDIVGLDTPIFTPSQNQDLFCSRPGLLGVSPVLANHLAKFAVFLRPVPQGKMGPALISGVVPCKVKVENTVSNPLTGQSWYDYADVEAGVFTRLILRPHGACRVLWKAATSAGDQWALVRIGNPTGIVTLRGTLLGALSQGSYADASLNYNGSTYTQRVYDYLMKSGATAIPTGKKILATYFPDEQKFYAAEVECP
jgi:hypothetical protein